MTTNVKTGIVLQGGGAFGAYEYGVMKALYETRGPNFKPAVITGLSIGAINAAVLAGADGDPMEALEEIWFKSLTILDNLPEPLHSLYDRFVPQFIQQHMSMLGNEAMYTIRPEYMVAPLVAPFITDSVCDTNPLRRTLEKILKGDKLNLPQTTQVILTAVNVATGELICFDNKKGRLTIDHILASGSLPGAFPKTKIGNRYYWDGGVNSNTPLSPAIDCLENQPAAEREIIVVELIPMQGQIPNNIMEVTSRFIELIFASKFRLDKSIFKKTDENIQFARKVQNLLSQCRECLKNGASCKDIAEIERTVEEIENDDAYVRLREKQTINRLIVVSPTRTDPGAGAGDFSEQTLRRRVEYGYEDGLQQFS